MQFPDMFFRWFGKMRYLCTQILMRMSESNFPTEYANLRPLHTSSYGNSRLFTAQSNGRKVVVKTLKADRADNAQCRAALRNEYELTASVDNKFVRKAIDFVQIEGLGDCLILEHVDGKSLAEHVRVGTLSEKQVKNILVDVCDGLAYMHRNQVVHGNLTPDNIMVTSDGCRAKLIDLGIPETDPTADRELLIKEMEMVAPEIIKGEDYDSRADIYSLGKIMEFIGERNISRHFLGVATHCTQFSKEQRYDSISEVRSAITKGHPAMKVVVLLLALVVLGVLAYVYVPKIKAYVEKERSERMSADFDRTVGNIRDELPDMIEKYRIRSVDEPVAPDWAADSLRFAQSLAPFFGSGDYKARAIATLNEQKAAIEASRQKDFDSLVVVKFKAENDTLVKALQAVQPSLTDQQWLDEARKWFGKMK